MPTPTVSRSRVLRRASLIHGEPPRHAEPLSSESRMILMPSALRHGVILLKVT